MKQLRVRQPPVTSRPATTGAERVLDALLVVGAAARLTRLATSDTITEPLRHRLLYTPEQRSAINQGSEDIPAPENPADADRRDAAHRFVTCPWCVGMWLSTVVVTVAAAAGHTPVVRLVAAALSTSYVVGALAQHTDD